MNGETKTNLGVADKEGRSASAHSRASLAAMGAPVSGTIVESKNFPEDLSVLVVDDDLLCLKVVEKMLKTCKYKGESGIESCGLMTYGTGG